jgi:hypothetical protein
MATSGPRRDDSRMAPPSACEVVSVRPLESPAGAWTISLEDVLDTVEELGSASLDLIAWELSIHVAELAGVWDHAVGEGLLRPAGSRTGAGEQMYAVAMLGRAAKRTSAHRTSSPVSPA